MNKEEYIASFIALVIENYDLGSWDEIIEAALLFTAATAGEYVPGQSNRPVLTLI